MTTPIHTEQVDFIAARTLAHLMAEGRKGLSQGVAQTVDLACTVIEREHGPGAVLGINVMDTHGAFQAQSVAALARGLVQGGEQGLTTAVREVYANVFAAAGLPTTGLYQDAPTATPVEYSSAPAPVHASQSATPASEAVQRRIMNCIVELLGVEQRDVTPNKTFVVDLGADSLDLIELTMSLEDEFDIEINDEDAERVFTVQEAFDLVHRLLVPAAGQR